MLASPKRSECFSPFIRTTKGGGAGQKQRQPGGKRGATGGVAGRVTKGGSSGLWMKRHLKVCTLGIELVFTPRGYCFGLVFHDAGSSSFTCTDSFVQGQCFFALRFVFSLHVAR